MSVRAGTLGCVVVLAVSLPCAVSAQAPTLEFVPEATTVGDCPGELFTVTLHVENSGEVEVGGFQAFLRYPARYFEPVRYENLELTGLFDIQGRPPLGSGFEPCPGSVEDPWSDGAGDDVVAVIASAYGDAQSKIFDGTSADLGRFVFRLRDLPTDDAGATFTSNEEICRPPLDPTTKAFGPQGDDLAATISPAFTVTIVEGGPHVQNLLCSDAPVGVRLTWDQATGGGVRGYRIFRNGEKVQEFPIPGVFEFLDLGAPSGRLVYEVAVIRTNSTEGCRESCEIEKQVRFIRGDADRVGGVTLTDAVTVLNMLFRGVVGTCLDAADADDSGSLNLTDAVRILGRLFRGEPNLPLPYPAAGTDPTPDDLTCEK